jgi:ribosome-associated translation inhibitor RaiA
MTKLVITGNGLEITDVMQKRALELMNKVFERYPPVSHSVTVKESNRDINISIHYHDNMAETHVNKDHPDFYSGMKLARDSLLKSLKSHHGTVKACRRTRINVVDEEQDLE